MVYRKRVHVWESSGHVHTVYSQMNERVTGEVIKKNHAKKSKNQRRPQSVWREVHILLLLEF